MATTFDSVKTYPPAMPDIERMIALNSSVLSKLDAAHQYFFGLITEEEQANPVVYWALMHIVMSIDSTINEVRIDSRRHEQTLNRLREMSK